MTDIDKLQLMAALCVAKFMSEKDYEICLSDGVNDFILEIQNAEYEDEGIKSTIDSYGSADIPDHTLESVITEAMGRLVRADVVKMFDEQFERYARRACLPYRLSDLQFETLKSRVESEHRSDNSNGGT